MEWEPDLVLPTKNTHHYIKIISCLARLPKEKCVCFRFYLIHKIMYFKMFKSEFFFLIDDDSSLSQIIEGSHQEFYGIYIYIYKRDEGCV